MALGSFLGCWQRNLTIPRQFTVSLLSPGQHRDISTIFKGPVVAVIDQHYEGVIRHDSSIWEAHEWSIISYLPLRMERCYKKGQKDSQFPGAYVVARAAQQAC